MPNLSPIINLPYEYIKGLQLAWASNTTLTVQSGVCRDSTNNIDINLGNFGNANPNISANAVTTLNIAQQGINGLDTHFGIAASTWYAIFVIADQSGYNNAGFIVSATLTQPLLPKGYDAIRRMGYIRTDGSSNILQFLQAGTDSNRFYQWITPIAVLTTGHALTYTSIDLSSAVPPKNQNPVVMNASISPQTNGNKVYIIPTATTQVTTPGFVLSSATASVAQFIPPVVFIPGVNNINNPSIDYHVDQSSDAATINICGFLDYL